MIHNNTLTSSDERKNTWQLIRTAGLAGKEARLNESIIYSLLTGTASEVSRCRCVIGWIIGWCQNARCLMVSTQQAWLALGVLVFGSYSSNVHLTVPAFLFDFSLRSCRYDRTIMILTPQRTSPFARCYVCFHPVFVLAIEYQFEREEELWLLQHKIWKIICSQITKYVISMRSAVASAPHSHPWMLFTYSHVVDFDVEKIV